MQYVGKNFFMIEFEDSEDRDTALALTPWFYECKYLYTFSWISDFDVTIGHKNMLHVWI